MVDNETLVRRLRMFGFQSTKEAANRIEELTKKLMDAEESRDHYKSELKLYTGADGDSWKKRVETAEAKLAEVTAEKNVLVSQILSLDKDADILAKHRQRARKIQAVVEAAKNAAKQINGPNWAAALHDLATAITALEEANDGKG